MNNRDLLCRSCLEVVDEGYDVFERVDKDLTLAAILNKFGIDRIDEKEDLPRILCAECSKLLLNFHNFVCTYETSTRTLRNVWVENESSDDKKMILESRPRKRPKTIPNTQGTNRKEIICDVCGKVCLRHSDLKDHMDSHTLEKNYSCKECNTKLKSRTSLYRHMLTHNNKKTYMCELCGQTFTLLTTLKQHKFLKHIRTKNFECIICNQKFALKSTLKKHVIRHGNRECDPKELVKFECIQCDAKYLDKTSLQRHIKSKHSNEKFNCDMCGKEFATFGNMKRHKKMYHAHAKTFVIEDINYILSNDILGT